ncbi:hypothetical protein [Vitiosangium sp. GDMCC 1.1324]|uniref:hypothetical protein n=1 Tax=Vitiosangium sp. (strain GDMCC 1.1324) TaxID=2138576 RepID=UPI000D3AEB13|nr:hypothetical protein [Vitiosangium sp. GDMCC 1.1324]PTL79314.1 hypothetical protein DAT35_34500 [Vitiosangium sp. GDMCC 1.1324]
MSIRHQQPISRVPGLLVLLLLAGCATGAPAGSMPGPITAASHRAPGHYAQSTDSATAGCLRNPACYNTLPGEEAIIPWLSNAANAARTGTTVAMMLQGADIKIIQQTLVQCAQKANEQVNKEDEELQGQEPTREQCKQVVRREGNQDVTRAMDLGARKHKVALDCVREAFAKQFSENIRVEPTYQKDPSTRLWRWIDPKQVAEWLQLGLTSQLWGALVPDIVIHATGNPNQLQRVYDFKFPCPATNSPQWGRYTKDQPHHPNDQGKMYEDALLGGKSKPMRVTSQGVQ